MSTPPEANPTAPRLPTPEEFGTTREQVSKHRQLFRHTWNLPKAPPSAAGGSAAPVVVLLLTGACALAWWLTPEDEASRRSVLGWSTALSAAVAAIATFRKRSEASYPETVLAHRAPSTTETLTRVRAFLMASSEQILGAPTSSGWHTEGAPAGDPWVAAMQQTQAHHAEGAATAERHGDWQRRQMHRLFELWIETGPTPGDIHPPQTLDASRSLHVVFANAILARYRPFMLGEHAWTDALCKPKALLPLPESYIREAAGVMIRLGERGDLQDWVGDDWLQLAESCKVVVLDLASYVDIAPDEVPKEAERNLRWRLQNRDVSRTLKQQHEDAQAYLATLTVAG